MASSSHQTTAGTTCASTTATAAALPNDGSTMPAYEVVKHNHKATCWNFFEKVRLENGVFKAKYVNCGKLFTTGGNSTLSRHVDSCTSKMAPESTQSQIGPTGYIWNYDQVLQREMQMKLIISQGLPFNHFDNDGMTSYIHQGLQPKYQKVSRITIRRDALRGYELTKKKLIAFFENFEGKISLTSDVWTAGQKLHMSFMCITCHWIDYNTWELNKRIIYFDQFELPHSGNAIYYNIMACLRQFKLRDKIMSISFDNASNNTSAINQLTRDLNPILNGAYFHTRCVCHVLNLIVQTGLHHIEPVIAKIRYMIAYIYSSQKRRQDFKKFVHSQDEKFLKPEIDMPVRWNSTYKMLQRALRQKTLLMEFYTNSTVSHDIVNEDWDLIEQLCLILRQFYKSTVVLSGVYYPTSSKVLGELFLITVTLKTWISHSSWKTCINEMIKKFLKYYRKIPMVFCCAAALDPAIGIDGVESLIEEINSNLGISEEEVHLGINEEDVNTSLGITNEEMNTNMTTKRFNETLNAMYMYYETLYGSRPREVCPQGKNSYMDSILSQAISRKKSKNIGASSELVKYSQTDFSLLVTQENYDLLQFWKNQSPYYPILAAMARDLLTIQASTVASESAFSFSGRVLNEKRSCLSPQSLEVCICYKDHLDAEKRQQNSESIEQSSEEVEEEIWEYEEIEDEN